MSTEENHLHPGPGGPGGNLCFHPGDDIDEPTAQHLAVGPGGGGGQACFHPGDADGTPTERLADDLAADLHLALTGIDDQQLAVLA
ncbi:hypothetical protein [Micromonospora robiginosa]|uniref:Uncharacterized protein n=1 Tax=Micromonospora robiginosa TaxID=2749844 RepID=A0A7L6B054_9ACTN|nr:hypothetical protein [Micromonospora ferruginea]QLQ35342.1 hypothetical protein H1D33_18285 [Micromonospora ferruginea]